MIRSPVVRVLQSTLMVSCKSWLKFSFWYRNPLKLHVWRYWLVEMLLKEGLGAISLPTPMMFDVGITFLFIPFFFFPPGYFPLLTTVTLANLLLYVWLMLGLQTFAHQHIELLWLYYTFISLFDHILVLVSLKFVL